MSSPLDTSDHVDHNFSIPFLDSDSFWPLLEDSSIFQATEDAYYDSNISFGHIFNEQESSSSAKASIHERLLENTSPVEASDNPYPLVQDKSILLSIEDDDVEKSSCNRFSSCCVHTLDHHQQEISMAAVLDSITKVGLIQENNTKHDREDNDRSLSTTFMQDFQNLCQILEQECHEHRVNNNCPEASETSRLHDLEEGSTSLPLDNHENINGGLNTNKRLKASKNVFEANEEEGPSNSKKREHNAKEKVRRMKLNATYLALEALLPYSRRTKKRRNAPFMIDRALEYIPELEKEIEKLTLRKDSLFQNQKLSQTPSHSDHDDDDQLQVPSVSVHEVVKGKEVIVQILCIKKDQDSPAFSNLLQNVEAQGMCILSASTLQVCEERVSYHLHIQMTESWSSILAADQAAILREKLISWLH